MTNSFEEYLSRPDIAQLAGVGRPAVTNWESRHHDFPRPGIVNGAEVFPTAAVEAWLDRRVITKNALREGEPPGTTYGTRFRNNLGTRSGTQGAATASALAAVSSTAESPAGLPEIALWEVLREAHGADRMTTVYRNVILGLVCLRATDPEGWANLAERDDENLTPDLFIARLTAFTPDLPRVFREAGFDQRWEPTFGRIVRAVDQAVSESGGAEIFRVLLDRFSSMEGRRRGEFYTPRSLARVLAATVMPGPDEQIYDPCCGSGEILVAAAIHARRDGGRTPPVHGFTWSPELSAVARLNLAVHGVDGDVAPRMSPMLDVPLSERAQYDVVVANPPFNMSLWSGQEAAYSWYWRYGSPPAHNANFAWLQYIVMSLKPGGRAAVIMPNGASASENTRERAIRTGLVDDNCVEGMIALPPQLFYSTTIPATVWLLGRPTSPRGEILFIDASNLGNMADRTHRVLSVEDVGAITEAADGWRRAKGRYEAIPGFSRSVPLEEVRGQGYVLNPRKYVSSANDPVKRSDTSRLHALGRRLESLHVRAAEADASVERELRRIGL